MEVWHVRHGERCDEIPRDSPERSAWRRSVVYREGRYYDPPLTEHGHVQASTAGLYLKSLPFNQGSEQDRAGFDRVYTSPLMRAVQTAVCVARELGGLPLQVVPGLCSCTAALVRIGYDRATLMTDADILATFPGVDLLPRDPLAPTSFRGAAAWLAGRAPDRRVLSVGHREGTKALAGRSVPTPHCCIGIFRVDGGRKRYTMHGLLSHEGHALGSHDCSTYAKPRLPTAEGNSVEPSMATLTLTPSTKPNGKQNYKQNGKQNGKPTHKPARSRRSDSDSGLLVLGEHRTEDDLQRRASAGDSKSNAVSTRGADGRSWRDKWSSRNSRISPGAAISNGASGANAKALGLVKRVPLKASVKAGVKETTFAAVRGDHRDRVPDIAAENRAAPLPQSKDNGARLTPENNGRGGGGGGGGGVHGPADGKPVAPPDSCAGRGFRAAALARRSVGNGSALPGILGVPPDTLCGPAGVLSYLRPTELCVAQVTCKSMTTAAESEPLWTVIYSRLPKRLRDQCEVNSATPAQADTSVTEGRAHSKALFARSVSITLSGRASRSARGIAVVRRRLGAIHSLRGSVDTLKATLAVRVDGVPASIVDTRGTRTEAWVSHANVLSEPTSCKGLRSFTFSSSTKVEVPPGLTAPSHLRSLSVAFSLPDSWLPRVAVASVDGPLLPGARLLGKSADGAVALYDVFDRNRGGGGGAALPPRPRGCALLGVLEGHPAGGKDSSGIGSLTVHLPHELLLDVGTRPPLNEQLPGVRRCQSYGDDAAGDRHGLENFTLGLGLRTAGVPVWEAAWAGAEGRLCPLLRGSRRERPGDAEEDRTVVCVDLVRPGDAAGHGTAAELRAERTLRGGPGLPYSTSGGLSGAVENVLIADFAAFDAHGDSLWAFASPIVFEASPVAAAGSKDDCIINMAHNEVREERRRGFVDEPGVGRVIVELALVESSTSDEDDTPVRAPARQRCPAGHEWIVRVARVDLELGFVNAWFGTKHGSP